MKNWAKGVLAGVVMAITMIPATAFRVLQVLSTTCTVPVAKASRKRVLLWIGDGDAVVLVSVAITYLLCKVIPSDAV